MSRKLLGALCFLLIGATAASAQMRVVSKFGKGRIQGRDAIVHVLVAVPPGADENQVAREALQRQHAQPLQAAEYSTIPGFKWSANSAGVAEVLQYYNHANAPSGFVESQILQILQATHDTWTDVASSGYVMTSGGTTTRCPSLVDECPGVQVFDKMNDVGWLDLGRIHPIVGGTLGVTWLGTDDDGTPEADMALNTRASWGIGSDTDLETVYLHENGHVGGLDHSGVLEAIMYPSYKYVQTDLHSDDVAGISFLYPSNPGPCTDDDGDGYCLEVDDCNDSDPTIYPGAPEICDGKANSCGGNIDDADGDGFVAAACAGGDDCDDLDPLINPGATELCDGTDNNCKDGIDEGGVCPMCTLAGELCATDAECCSLKCRGRPGTKTCN